MQKMLNICTVIAEKNDMSFNTKKSVAIRIGSRYKMPCAALSLDGNDLCYVAQVKYLGVTIKTGKQFTCSYDHVRVSFYRAFNALYCKSKANESELASVFLVKSFCVPTITYCLDVTDPTIGNLHTLDKLIDNAMRKIFNVCDDAVVHSMRSVLALRSVTSICHTAAFKFLLIFAKKPLSFNLT